MKKTLILSCFLLLIGSCSKSEGFETSFISIDLSNITDQMDCSLNPYEIEFVLSWKNPRAESEKQISRTLSEGMQEEVTLLIADRVVEEVLIYGTQNDVVLAEREVSVRTSSRPRNLNGMKRKIEFCDNFRVNFVYF